MKRNIFLAILLAAAVSFSCTSVEEPMQVERAREGSTVFNPVAVITPFVLDGPETKTVLTIDETTGAKFTFVETDVLGVYPTFPEAGTQVAFEVKSIDTDGVVFNGGGFGLKEGNEYAVYYPFTPDGCETIAQAEAYVQEFPVDYSGQRQTKVDGTFDISAKDYLVAIGVAPENGVCTMNMEHVGALAVMDVTLTGSAKKTYKAVTLSSQTENFIVSGEIDLTNNAEIWNNTGVSTTVSLALGNGTSGLKLKPGKTYRFCMMVAPVDMSSETLTLALVDDEDNVYSATVDGRNFKAGKAYKLAATIAGPDLTEPTNLSANGTANCYIVDTDAVNPLGYYFNATVAGNGVTVDLDAVSPVYPSSASISGNNALVKLNQNNCITDVAYDATHNTITFKATGNKGNAKITLLNGSVDDNDYYVWNWIIWCTDEPGEVSLISPTTKINYTLLDRNIGATSCLSGNTEAEYGLYFMFGDPMGYTVAEWNNASTDGWEMFTEIKTVNKPYCDIASTGGFYWFSPYSSSLSNGLFGRLWGGGSNNTGDLKAGVVSIKTLYDPCPVGYKVMAYDVLYNLASTAAFSRTDSNGLYLDGTDGTLFFPYNGNVFTGGYTWMRAGAFMYLWTSGHNGRNMAWCHVIQDPASGNDIGQGLQPHIIGRGMGVRCMKQ